MPFILALVGAASLVAAAVWWRSARRLRVVWHRVRAEEGTEADVTVLARSHYRKDLHTSVLYTSIALASGSFALAEDVVGGVVFFLLLVPVTLSIFYGKDFVRESRIAEDRSKLERKAEEVLSQEELAPKRWADRLAPEVLPEFDGFELGRRYQAGTGHMAGDFYDVIKVGASRVAAVIGDVTGKGIDASITAFQAKYLLRVFLRQYRDPGQAIEELNDQMSALRRTDEELISIFVVVLDTEHGTLRYASAGHPAAWMWHDRDVRPLKAHRGARHARRRERVPQQGDPAREGRPAAALHRRPGRGAQRRADVRRGAHRQHAAPRPQRLARRAVQEPARGRPRLRLRADGRRRGHPGHPPLLTAWSNPKGHEQTHDLARLTERALAGNLAKVGDKLAAQNKLFVRDRLALLLDEGSFVEDGLLANNRADDLPADGVVTGVGRVEGRPVCVMANDPTVKAGSWGARTVEKIVRLTEHALRHELPVFWLVDSAGARITDQVELFPGRRGAGRIFYNEVAPVGPGAPGVLPVRPVRRRRRLHPQLLRRGVHGRGERLDVPGLAPHGRDGHRRARLARADGRRPHARHGVGLRRQPGRRRRGRHRPGQGVVLVLPADLAVVAAPLRAGGAGPGADRRDGPRRGARRLRRARR